jgi:hypothetical protein
VGGTNSNRGILLSIFKHRVRFASKKLTPFLFVRVICLKKRRCCDGCRNRSCRVRRCTASIALFHLVRDRNSADVAVLLFRSSIRFLMPFGIAPEPPPQPEDAVKLAANPSEEEPASRTCPVATVVIPDGGESDLFAGSSGVNVPAGKREQRRVRQGGQASQQAVAKGVNR